jgi:hypothetical protein
MYRIEMQPEARIRAIPLLAWRFWSNGQAARHQPRKQFSSAAFTVTLPTAVSGARSHFVSMTVAASPIRIGWMSDCRISGDERVS